MAFARSRIPKGTRRRWRPEARRPHCRAFTPEHQPVLLRRCRLGPRTSPQPPPQLTRRGTASRPLLRPRTVPSPWTRGDLRVRLLRSPATSWPHAAPGLTPHRRRPVSPRNPHPTPRPLPRLIPSCASLISCAAPLPHRPHTPRPGPFDRTRGPELTSGNKTSQVRPERRSPDSLPRAAPRPALSFQVQRAQLRVQRQG